MDDHDLVLKPMVTWGSPMSKTPPYLSLCMYIYIYINSSTVSCFAIPLDLSQVQGCFYNRCSRVFLQPISIPFCSLMGGRTKDWVGKLERTTPEQSWMQRSSTQARSVVLQSLWICHKFKVVFTTDFHPNSSIHLC